MTIERLSTAVGQTITLQGWVMGKRTGKGLVFLIVRDGSGLCQCIVDENKVDTAIFEDAKRITQESSLRITGQVVADERQVGGYELHVNALEIVSLSQDFPITPKEHGIDFLMDHRHLWLRSKRQWAIMRIRNTIIMAIHEFFQGEGFLQTDAPIFTGNAVEGTSTLFETDFYGEPAYLSQSGQLYGEAMAMAFGKIYTFGPTFRAEKSKTRRHLSEFWMIEPEMAFHDLDMNMDTIERFLRFVVLKVLDKNTVELDMIGRDTTVLKQITEPFPRITYENAVKILKGELEVDGKNAIKTLEADLVEVQARIAAIQVDMADREAKIAAPGMKKGEIGFHQSKIQQLKEELSEQEEAARNIPVWLKSARDFRMGNDFGGSDETVLTRLFNTPIMVYNWPHEVKAFYMKRDEQDARWAKGVDVLAPEGYGEIVGGGERETQLDLLIEKIHEHELPMAAFEWYLDLRRFGSVPHAGFGLGLERLVAWTCKLPHVRETIPFPRMYGRIAP